MQHGVVSAPTQPALTGRPQPTALLSGGVSIPMPQGESTVVSLPTARGPDSLNPFIEGTRREDATEVLRRGPPLGQRLRVQFQRLKAAMGSMMATLAGPATQTRNPNTQNPNTQNPSTLTMRLTQHLREPRSVRILVTLVVVLALTATILTYNRRTSSDKQLFDAAVAADTVAAYQHYLQACRTCAHRSDAEAAVTRLQKAGQVADIQSHFKELLGQGRLKAPADPNASSVLHDLEAAAPNDPHIADDRASLATAIRSEEKQAADKKSAQLAAQRRVAKAAQKPKPSSKSTSSASQTAAASAAEQMPKPVFAPQPKYPSDAKGVSGWVDVEFNVNVDGSTSSAEVVGSQPQGVFDDAALHAIHTWIFTPYTENGVRARKRIRMRIQFKP